MRLKSQQAEQLESKVPFPSFACSLPKIPKQSPLASLSPEQIDNLTDSILYKNFTTDEIDEISRVLERREEINDKLKSSKSEEEMAAILKEYDTKDYEKENEFMQMMEKKQDAVFRRELPELFKDEMEPTPST